MELNVHCTLKLSVAKRNIQYWKNFMIKKQSFLNLSIIFSVVSILSFLLGLHFCDSITKLGKIPSAIDDRILYSMGAFVFAILATISGVPGGLFAVLNFKKSETKVLFLTILTGACFTFQTIIYICLSTRESIFYSFAMYLYLAFFCGVMIISTVVAGAFGIILSAKRIKKQNSRGFFTATLAINSAVGAVLLIFLSFLYFKNVLGI